MSQRSQEIQGSQIWGQMDVLGASIDKVAANDNIDPESRALAERLRAVLTFTGKRIAGTDQGLISIPVLDQIATIFDSVTRELDALASTLDPQHARNADSHADSALVAASQIPVATPIELTGLLQASTQYVETLGRQMVQAQHWVQEAQQSVEVLQQNVARLSEEAAADRERSSTSVAEQQIHFTEARGKMVQELAEALRSIQQRLDQVIAEHQSQFSNAQDSRSTEFNSAQGNRQDGFNTLIKQYNDQLQHLDSESRRHLEALNNDQKVNIEKLQSQYEQRAKQILEAIEN